MAHYRGYRGRRRYSSNDIGRERALQHIREAEELSRELGGTDKDVKEYFFSLPPDKLKLVLDDYEKKYDKEKREYAEETFSLWKSGKRKMSGLVASRLFNLLPPRMPLQAKYSLVKNLWKEYCPRSNRVVFIGANAEEEIITNTIQDHLLETVVNYEIPDPLQKRFQWLSSGDVNVQQELLNYLLQLSNFRLGFCV